MYISDGNDLFLWLLLSFNVCFGDAILCVLTMAFAADPQDELDRKEGRLAVMADHLGFSWTGKSSMSLVISQEH